MSDRQMLLLLKKIIKKFCVEMSRKVQWMDVNIKNGIHFFNKFVKVVGSFPYVVDFPSSRASPLETCEFYIKCFLE